MIQLATTDDAPGVQAIYAPIVQETAISFELEPPTVCDRPDALTMSRN